MMSGFSLGPVDGPKGPPRKYLLMAERADGTGRMVYDQGDDLEAMLSRAKLRTTPRTRFWVEDNPEAQGEP